MKLLASAAVVAYARRDEHDPKLAERLTNLTRPSLGHWWESVRLLVPVLANAGDKDFANLRDLVLGRTRDDLPRTAGLHAALGQLLGQQGGARNTVRLSELFDRLVRCRNQELGHGATGQRGSDFYSRMSQALLGAMTELLSRLDVLAGRRLVYVAEVRRQSSGAWLIERYELMGETARRIESLEGLAADAGRLPHPERVYLEPVSRGPAAGPPAEAADPFLLRPLHPLLTYDANAGEALFLNARRGQKQIEYLCYTTGRVVKLQGWTTEHRGLLARLLGTPVDA